MQTLSGKAFAKINLVLRILDRRSDGFHELRTVYQAISLADRLTVGFEPGPAGITVELHCSAPELETDDNIVCRAARELLGRLGIGGRVRIGLDKRIPHGAGLGGGSSDAAATLMALERLIQPRPAAAVVYQAACALGSDVPFFLIGGRAAGVGRGEEVCPLPDQPRSWLVVAVPAARVATADAYRNLAAARGGTLTQDRKGFILSSFWAGLGAPDRAGSDTDADWANDFEETVFDSLPALKPLKQRLRDAGAARALLSGSGSALFGVFGDRASALKAKQLLVGGGGRSLGGESAVEAHVARTVGRSECRRCWNVSKESS
jgi:4-diphosphocytidyl-2-C-methyl-D-erythritol kinase